MVTETGLCGFVQEDFETFAIEGLEARMEAIQQRIQPKFKAIGEELCEEVSILTGNEMYLHIAKHARRTVNPPKDTWMAIAHDKRGYKKHPHFQLGLFDDHVFVWLAFIYELPNKREIAQQFLDHVEKVKKTVPRDFVVSSDHMQKGAVSAGDLTAEEWAQTLTRFRDVKKAEFLVGRHISANDPILQEGERLVALVKDTYATLMPLYRMAFE